MNTNPIKISLLVLASVLLTGCIKNNIPYPRIQVNFQKFEVKDEIRTASIDSTNMQLTVFLSEAADIYAVDVLNYTLTPGGEVIGDIKATASHVEDVSGVPVDNNRQTGYRQVFHSGIADRLINN